MKRLLAPLMIIPALFLAGPAQAWDDTGHMVVAQIAYSRLNPVARANVDRLARRLSFRNRRYTFVTSGCWMDDIRDDPDNSVYAPWHYINVPFFDGIPPRELPPQPRNVLTQIRWSHDMLGRGSGSEDVDSRLLGYLVHLVGDVHQPLHTTSRFTPALPNGDAGGNRFMLGGVPGVNNLHAFWDRSAGLFGFTRLPRPLNQASWRRLRAFSQRVTAAHPADDSLPWREMNPEEWVQEGFRISTSFVYTTVEGETPSPEYVAGARETCSERLALAGYRLGEMLNEIFRPR